MTTFYMHLSCYVLAREQAKEVYLIEFFRKRITEQRFSNLWKLAFLGTKYV